MNTKILTIKDKINLINDLKGELRKDLINYFTTRLKNNVEGCDEIEIKNTSIETNLFHYKSNGIIGFNAVLLYYNKETEDTILVIEDDYGDEFSASIKDYELDVMIDIYNSISK